MQYLCSLLSVIVALDGNATSEQHAHADTQRFTVTELSVITENIRVRAQQSRHPLQQVSSNPAWWSLREKTRSDQASYIRTRTAFKLFMFDGTLCIFAALCIIPYLMYYNSYSNSFKGVLTAVFGARTQEPGERGQL